MVHHDGRRVNEAVRRPHGRHPSLQRLLEPVAQLGALRLAEAGNLAARRGRGRRGRVGGVLVTLGRRPFLLGGHGVLAKLGVQVVRRLDALDPLAVELAHGVHDKLVNGRVAKEHLGVASAKAFVVRRRLGCRPRRRDNVVHGLLTRRHSGHVLVQRRHLSRLRLGRLEPQQLGQVILVRLIAANAFLQKRPKLLEKGNVVLGLGASLFGEEAEEATREDDREAAHQRLVLQCLTGDVEGDVLAVYHATHEPHPVRQ
mmetsp:Transcript_7220/g.23104  ORF Transcript_7220/g.23104 Transcript_7220/m.23104 type:complete len:257 (-) Transcript_7220:1125-1895(-)